MANNYLRVKLTDGENQHLTGAKVEINTAAIFSF